MCVSLLSVINGRSGEKEGEKIIKPLFDKMISIELKAKFTWSGRTTLGYTKMPFSVYKEVVSLLFTVVRLADANYTTTQCQRDVTYRVLKHACAKTNRFVIINLIFSIYTNTYWSWSQRTLNSLWCYWRVIVMVNFVFIYNFIFELDCNLFIFWAMKLWESMKII